VLTGQKVGNCMKKLMNVVALFHPISLRIRIQRALKVYSDNRKGELLAYRLTHPDSYNFENEQKELLFTILNYAKKNVPYYRTLISNIQLDKQSVISQLKVLPLLSKAIIREQMENIYSDQFEKDFSYWKKTGGSTGEPLKYPVSRNFEHVHGRCFYTIMGLNKKDTIVAIDGTQINKDLQEKKIFWEEGKPNFPYGSVHYSTAHMYDENMPYYIDHLNSIKPALMRGHTSGFQYLSKYLIKNQIKLQFKLKGIYLTAESIDSACTEILKESFNCPVYGQYGHSEVSIFAFTMADSFEYICSPIYGYTEILDEQGKHVNEGESGEVVVTGFSNKVMPFIRYKTGDIAVYGGTKNGVVKLKSLQGRTMDYLVNENNKKLFLLGINFSKSIVAFDKIIRWQIEQNIPGGITIRIVQDLLFTEMEKDQIIQFFNTLGLKAELKFVENIPLTISGKRRFLIQNIV
jgi:phenylacetate-CoA ligase